MDPPILGIYTNLNTYLLGLVYVQNGLSVCLQCEAEQQLLVQSCEEKR